MAARKLKFKPKPVVGGTVRRTREKEELSELISTEPNISNKESSVLNSLTSHTETSESANNDEQNTTVNLNSDCVENVSKKLKTEHIVPVNKTKVSEYIEMSEDNISPNITNTETNSPEIKKSHAQLTDFSISKIVSCESNLTPSNVTNNKEITADQSNPTESAPSKSSPKKDYFSQSSSSQEPIDNNKLTEKINTGKGLSRFGRGRFKPVLNNSVVRKKVEPSIPVESGVPEAMVQTESIIKCVESETKKSNSLVSEITESFSALESDEMNPPQLSLSPAPDLQENDVSIAPMRFEYDHEDVQSTFNNSLSSILNRSMPNAPTQTITNSHQISDKPEIINANIQNPSPTKVSISPLKSTSKILVPKPCPNLLDTAGRRLSFHGSDSEEESKRKKHKKCEDSSKSSSKVKKEKDVKKSKRKRTQGSTYSKLGQETLQKFNEKFGKIENLGPPDKAKLTMLDLIFYNPKSNPMSVNNDQVQGVQKKEANIEISTEVKEALMEESVDDVEPEAATVPVPQLKVGPDGQVMLDPNSLVIETTEVKEKRAEMEKSAVIRETGITRYNTYSKKKHNRKDWAVQETLQFYKALNTIGTDFTLMTKLFPTRSRHDLKLKFKREEKINMNLVDKAMTAPADFDFSSLEEEMRRENEEIAKKAQEKKLAAEAAKRERAQKKEEKVKKKPKAFLKYIRPKGAVFLEFEDSEIKKMSRTPHSINIRKRTRKMSRTSRSINKEKELNERNRTKSTLEIGTKERKSSHVIKTKLRNPFPSSDEEELLQIDPESDDEDERVMTKDKYKKSIHVKKLEEYEEINESLKKTLEGIESDSDDGYTPNGISADMLFGSPASLSEDELQESEKQWTVNISSIPSVEETVLKKNYEEVSELSELGSFGQNDTALDLSSPLRKSVDSEIQQGSLSRNSVLHSHLISQSIKIIDQLTSNENLAMDCEKNSSELNDVIETNPSPHPTKLESGESQIPLPSFEYVSRSRPSLVYSQKSYVHVQPDDQSNEENEVRFIPVQPKNQLNEIDNGQDKPSIVLSSYFNDDENTILGN